MDAPILLTRPAEAPRQTLAEYRDEGGVEGLQNALKMSPGEVVAAIEAAGLRGRGGACFPTARKWQLALEQEETQRYVVANGGEHEPGSEKDKHLVAKYPHKVLEGMLICGYATGAQRGILYLIEDMEAQIEAGDAALAELREAGLLGTGILGTGFDFEIEIHRAPPTYVAGEETAAIDSINGGEGKPRKKPPYPGVAGVDGKPTTVNNTETLALAAVILRSGPEAFAALGTESSKGTMLFTLDAKVQRPGVYELPFGRTYRDLIYGCGGGPKSGRAIRGFLPALSCRYLPGEALDTPIDFEALRELGTSPGCGGVSFLEEGEDVVARIVQIAQFFMAEHCGQCPACKMVTNQIPHILKGIQAGKGPGYDKQLKTLQAFAPGKGYCSLPVMATAAVISGVELFAEDFATLAGPGGD